MTPGHHLPQDRGHEVFCEPSEHAAVPAVHITLEVSHVKSSRAILTSLIRLLPREAHGLLPRVAFLPLPNQNARLLQQMEQPQPCGTHSRQTGARQTVVTPPLSSPPQP